jgi:hypothetical protein
VAGLLRAQKEGKMAASQETTSSHSGSTMEQARGQLQEMTGKARSQASSGLESQVDQRSTRAGAQIKSLGEAVGRAGEQLRDQGNDRPAQLADQFASRVRGFGEYLERTDGRTILRDAEDFGRRQPWVVAVGGLVAGLFASRVIKASSTSPSTRSTSTDSRAAQQQAVTETSEFTAERVSGGV